MNLDAELQRVVWSLLVEAFKQSNADGQAHVLLFLAGLQG